MKKVNQHLVRGGFTLVELMVVIGIIAMLIGLFLPALSSARLQGDRVKCLSNLKTIGDYMLFYSNENKGLLIPIGPLEDGVAMVAPDYNSTKVVSDNGGSAPFEYQTLGSEVYPWQRWPYLLIKQYYPGIPGTPGSPYTGPLSKYLPNEPSPGDPTGIYAGPWTPKVMVCPSDPQPGAAHSYLFNQHLVQNQQKVLKYAGKPPSGRTDSQVVVVGEKKSVKDDYYMEQGDISTDPAIQSVSHVETHRHGVRLGSNYLYKDFHAANEPPKALSNEVDPWDTVPVNTTSSGN